MAINPLLLVLSFIVTFFLQLQEKKPVLYIIGDSTVASSSDRNAIQGWGKAIEGQFDTSRITIRNQAVSGTSSRTYATGITHDPDLFRGHPWSHTLRQIKAGDYVIMQFGHNDESPVADTSRMRGSLKGTGTDSVMVFNIFTKKQETVYTYGHYLRVMVQQVQHKGAMAIICSPIPKNKWKEGHVLRNTVDYGKWAKEVALHSNAAFISLNELIANQYDQEGKAKVSASYFVADGVHTTQAGAALNALLMRRAIQNLRGSQLKSYLKP